jgi:hypothetical protein
MADVIKIGNPLERVVFDGGKRAVRYKFLKSIPYDQVKQIRLCEVITAYEQEQLLNLHPEVEKEIRDAELWLDLKNGQKEHLGTYEQAGLLLSQVAEAARQMNVQIISERIRIDPEGAVIKQVNG